MASCHTCGRTTARYSRRLTPAGLVTTCFSCLHPSTVSCANPFAELVLDHAHDDQGQPIRVSSLRQLRQAEAKHKFKALISYADAEHFDEPPKSGEGDLFKHMDDGNKWLHPEIAHEMIQEMKEAGELYGLGLVNG